MDKKAIVLAGGQGVRLRPLTSNQPKPMLSVANRPLLEHIIELLAANGYLDIVLTLQFLPSTITNYFGDGSNLGVNLTYVVEEIPLGTAGSVRNARGFLDSPFLVISGDALTDIELEKVVEFHLNKGASVTIVLKKVQNPLEFGIVICDSDGRVKMFLEKPGWGDVFSDTINTGIYVINPDVLDYIPDGTQFDFAKDLFPL
ncbi:MAG: nucleotidyltransferase family protein, partial [Actinomycetota bacterium]|nr:nucleotidyltransferase family protein [Actinomycetota bacterium]